MVNSSLYSPRSGSSRPSTFLETGESWAILRGCTVSTDGTQTRFVDPLIPDLHAGCLRQRRALCRLGRRRPRVRRRSRLVRVPLACHWLRSPRPSVRDTIRSLSKGTIGVQVLAVDLLPGRPPYHFRLLSDGLLGYVWPKWVKAGEKSEFRVHSVEPYHLSLWRYGFKKEQSAVWAGSTSTAHVPRCRSRPMAITRGPVSPGTNSATLTRHIHQYVVAPQQSGLYYFHARTARGAEFAFPWIVAPTFPRAPVAVLASNITGTRTTTSAAVATTSTPTACRRAHGQRPARAQAVHRSRRRHVRYRRLRGVVV